MAVTLQNGKTHSKSQVTFEYVDERPTKVKSVVISTQHSADIDQAKVRELLRPYLLKSIPENFLKDFNEEEFYVNPTGNFVIGGPDGDCGLTGRKIIVDTYGGAAQHGGGAFSGKDPTKVDRSAAYAAKQVAKHVVAAGLADRALVQVAYAIGVSRPMSFLVDTFGTNKVDQNAITQAVNEIFDMRPKAIVQRLDLLRPIYSETAAYGHFGRESKDGFTWENLTHLEELKSKF